VKFPVLNNIRGIIQQCIWDKYAQSAGLADNLAMAAEDENPPIV